MSEQDQIVSDNSAAGSGGLKPGQRIVVIGGSTGGFEAFKKIIKNLPANFQPPVFIAWHMGADVHGILPDVLNRQNTIYAAHGYDGEVILPNRIYVAPPDYHLLVQDGKVRITHGPKENRFRPAVDPLFRSAALAFGNSVIGIILSGGLDDGTAGLWSVKHHGGIAVVQDPVEAEVRSMPENAIRHLDVDYCVSVSEMADLLVRLDKEPITGNIEFMEDEQSKKEIEIAAEVNPMAIGFMKFGELTPYSCPECHGVLSRLHNDNIIRYRCHTGHAYSTDALMTALTEKIEDSLYSAIRGMDESMILLNHMGDHYSESNQPKLAAVYFKKAKEVDARSQLVRKATMTHEQLSKAMLRAKAHELEIDPDPKV